MRLAFMSLVAKSLIDIAREDLKEMKKSKFIPGESTGGQHKLLMMYWSF